MMRLFLRITTCSFFCILLSCNASVTQNADRPVNIVFIMADDLGYGDVEPYGQSKIKTPKLVKMREEGMLFSQFYAGTTVCAPSRASLITGKHTGHTAVRGNRQFGRRNGQMPLGENEFTLAKLMQDNGYNTGLIGKWGLGDPNTTGNPLEQGFDFYYGYTDQILAHNYYPEYVWRNGEKEYLDNKVKYLSVNEWHQGLGSISTVKNTYSNDLFVKEALHFIEDKKSEPFFLYLSLTLPHDNGEQSENEIFEVPDQGIYANKPWTKNQKDYAAMVSRVDSVVGSIRGQLQKLNLDENTLVIFTSDNGPKRDSDTARFFDSNGKLRGGKRDLYEGGIRMPFLAVLPKKIKANSTSDHVAAFWDILPTFANVIGADTISGLDGVSFLPTLFQKGIQQKHKSLYWEFHNSAGSLQALRKDDLKLVKHYDVKANALKVELFDLSKDIGETVDISNDSKNIVKELDSLLSASRTPSEFFKIPNID